VCVCVCVYVCVREKEQERVCARKGEQQITLLMTLLQGFVLLV